MQGPTAQSTRATAAPLDTTPRRVPFLTAEWRHLAMLNYAVNPELLEPFRPPGTIIDTFQGKAWISIVGFLFQKTKILGVPLFWHREFEEVNLRFYVRRRAGDEWRRGVVFIKEIVPRMLISRSARFFYNENYATHPMRHVVEHDGNRNRFEYDWQVNGRWHELKITTMGDAQPLRVGSFEEFIADHAWGYTCQRDGSCLEYNVVHPRWNFWNAVDASLACNGASIYGDRFDTVLARSPDSALALDGSAVSVYAGHRI